MPRPILWFGFLDPKISPLHPYGIRLSPLNNPVWPVVYTPPFPKSFPNRTLPVSISFVSRETYSIPNFPDSSRSTKILYWSVFEYLSRTFGLFDMSHLNPSLRDILHFSWPSDLCTLSHSHRTQLYHWLLSFVLCFVLNTSSSTNYATSDHLKRDALF
jgi:hypothetical protein